MAFSASSALPSVHTEASTTRSRRSCRYSTSLMSDRSVDIPGTRVSASRASRSNWSPSQFSSEPVSPDPVSSGPAGSSRWWPWWVAEC